jgi:hypothetical protein
MDLDLPARADGNREMVSVPGPRCVDQSARMMFRATAMAMDHVQDAAQ